MPGTYFSISIVVSWRKTCNERSFCANGCPATLNKSKIFRNKWENRFRHLLINCSKARRRSSIKSSSKIPSSRRRNAGTCLLKAFDGKVGTTILKKKNFTNKNSLKKSKSNFTIAFEFFSQPFEIRIPSSNWTFFQSKNG